MVTMKEFFRWLRLTRLQHRKMQKMKEQISRLMGEKHNTSAELHNIQIILVKEDGQRIFSVFLNRVLLIIAVSDWLPNRVESRIYMPSFSPVELGRTRFKKDENAETCVADEIYMTPNFRRIGLGSVLVKTTIVYLAGLKVKFTIGGNFLVLEKDIEQVKRFFERLDFEVIVNGSEILIHYTNKRII